MDSEVDDNKIPSLIKIDVEGHEVEVLEGAVAYLI
jgi:FkbM family methyltransferase